MCMNKKEIIEKLHYDVKQLFKTGARFGIFIAIPVLRNDEKLSADLFRVFKDDLTQYLICNNVDVSQIALPTTSNKTKKQLRDEIEYAATKKGNKLLNKAVVISVGKGWFNRFNTMTEPQYIIDLIPLLEEMALVLTK